jgi:hypothetical protein
MHVNVINTATADGWCATLKMATSAAEVSYYPGTDANWDTSGR